MNLPDSACQSFCRPAVTGAGQYMLTVNVLQSDLPSFEPRHLLFYRVFKFLCIRRHLFRVKDSVPYSLRSSFGLL